MYCIFDATDKILIDSDTMMKEAVQMWKLHTVEAVLFGIHNKNNETKLDKLGWAYRTKLRGKECILVPLVWERKRLHGGYKSR